MWDREKLDELCEQALVGIVLALVTVAVVGFGGVRASEFALVGGLAALALVVWVFRLWLNPSGRLLLHPILIPGLGFVAYAAWRMTGVDVIYPARRELMLLIVAAIVFGVALNNFYRQETTQWVIHALVVLGGAVAAYAIIQWVSGSNRILWLLQPASYVKRAGGPFVNPNHLAGFLVLLLPLALAQVFVGRGKAVSRVLHGYAALMMAGGIAVSMSRGGWASAALALMVLFGWLGWRRRELRLPVVLAMVVFAVGGISFLMRSEKARARIENLSTDGTLDSAGRRDLWKPAVAMWRDHRWLGVGPAQFDVNFPAYRTPRFQASPVRVHNEYLNLLVDYGAAGALAAGLVLAALIWGAVASSRYVERASGDLVARGSNRTAVFLGSWVGLLGLSAHCVVDFDLHIPGIAVTASLVAALLAACVRYSTERFWFKPGLAGCVLITAGAGALLGWMLPATVRLGREGLVLNRVRQTRVLTPAILADLELALREAPDNPRTAYELGEAQRRLSLQGENSWQEHANRALAAFSKAIQLNPHDARAQLALGQTYHWLNQPEAAAGAFTQALKLGPNDVEITNAVAWYLLQQGRAAEAKRMAQQSLAWQWWSNPLAQDILQQSDQRLKAGAPAP
ncbi:MAG: O-antigen ligase family protein [Verrucomicrobiales bacterium]|nr:O-antigen ligase family protein [Verrucomicrobiales bacterium]